MRFLTALIALMTTGVVSRSIPEGNDQNAIIKDDLAVPGNSPLKFCDADRADNLAMIETVNLSPNPPQAGQTLEIEASADVKEQIEQGAYIQLVVKYGYIRLVRTKADFCEQIKSINMTCPLEKGKISIVKTVDLPKEIPPGGYSVFADVYSADKRKITCLTAAVTFGDKKEMFGFEL